MKGVSFNGIHSFNDLNLILAPFEEGSPTIKENYIDVPGADAGIDLTGLFGEVKYNYREFDLTFSALPSDDWETKKRQVTNLLHGLECDMIFDRNPNYRLHGRISVSDRKSNKLNRQIIIHAKTSPYWLKTTDTIYTYTFNHTKNLAPRLNEWTCIQYTSTPITTETPVYVKNDVAYINSKSGGEQHIRTDVFLSGETSLSIQCSTNQTSLRCMYNFYNSSNAPIGGSGAISLTNGKYTNLTVPSGASRMRFSIRPVGTSGLTVLSKIQIESGSVCTDYEPKNGILVVNENKDVLPLFVTTANTTIVDNNNNQYTVNAGEHKLLDVSIPHGESIITATGNGTLTVKFTERAL